MRLLFFFRSKNDGAPWQKLDASSGFCCGAIFRVEDALYSLSAAAIFAFSVGSGTNALIYDTDVIHFNSCRGLGRPANPRRPGQACSTQAPHANSLSILDKRIERHRYPHSPMNHNVPLIPRKSRQGFSLVEITIALALVSFGLVVLFALLPTGLNLVKQSADEGVVVNILTMVAADFQSVQRGSNFTPRFRIPFRAGESSGLLGSATPLFFDESGMWLPDVVASNPQQAAEAGAFFMGSYSILSRDSAPNTSANALLMVSWPAMATTPSGNVSILVVLPENPPAGGSSQP